jgi:hypothetical protein
MNGIGVHLSTPPPYPEIVVKDYEEKDGFDVVEGRKWLSKVWTCCWGRKDQ